MHCVNRNRHVFRRVNHSSFERTNTHSISYNCLTIGFFFSSCHTMQQFVVPLLFTSNQSILGLFGELYSIEQSQTFPRHSLQKVTCSFPTLLYTILKLQRLFRNLICHTRDSNVRKIFAVTGSMCSITIQEFMRSVN